MNGLIQRLATKADIDLSYSDILGISNYSRSGFTYTYKYSLLGNNYKLLCIGGINQTDDSITDNQYGLTLFEINVSKVTSKIINSYTWNYKLSSYPWVLEFYDSSGTIYPQMKNINTQATAGWRWSNWCGIFYK